MMRLEFSSLPVALRRAAACVLVCGLAMPALALAQQTRPSLGEIARQEAERRKALTKAAKVYTKDDLPKTALLPPPGTAAPAAPGEESEPKPGEAGDKAAQAGQDATGGDAKDAAWWLNRVAQVREGIRRNEMFAQALQTRINSLSADFASRDDPLQRAQVAEERTKALAEMEQVSKEIQLLQQQIADIEAEARKAGVPAGWLR